MQRLSLAAIQHILAGQESNVFETKSMWTNKVKKQVKHFWYSDNVWLSPSSFSAEKEHEKLSWATNKTYDCAQLAYNQASKKGQEKCVSICFFVDDSFANASKNVAFVREVLFNQQAGTDKKPQKYFFVLIQIQSIRD